MLRPARLSPPSILQVGADTAVASAAAAAKVPGAPEPPTAASTAAAAAAAAAPGARGAAASPPTNGPAEIGWRGARQALGSGAFRVALLALAALSAASALVHQHAAVPGADGGASKAAGESVAQLALGTPGAEAWQLGCAALGFLMYKGGGRGEWARRASRRWAEAARVAASSRGVRVLGLHSVLGNQQLAALQPCDTLLVAQGVELIPSSRRGLSRGRHAAECVPSLPAAPEPGLAPAAAPSARAAVAILGVSMTPGAGQGPGGQSADVIQFQKNQGNAS